MLFHDSVYTNCPEQGNLQTQKVDSMGPRGWGAGVKVREMTTDRHVVLFYRGSWKDSRIRLP